MNRKHLGMGILIAALFLTGCGRQKITSYEPDTTHASLPETKLTFFGYKYEALNVMAIEDALHGFMDVYPHISISYDGIKSPEYFEVLDKRLDTGNGDDIFMVDHEHVLNLGGSGDWLTFPAFPPLMTSATWPKAR